MRFRDRYDAGEKLADALSAYQGQNPLILAIPRGGVVLGRVISDRLQGELNLLLVRKIGHPNNPEFALAAVSEDRTLVFPDPSLKNALSPRFLEEAKEQELRRIQEARARWGKGLPPPDPRDRVVIVVDDGIATGATMLCGLQGIRRHNPRHLVASAPVAPGEVLDLLRSEADEVVILYTPDSFYAVGQFYERFDAVEDEEVVRLLRSEK
jgi:predicted phosphoribosyltransferase